MMEIKIMPKKSISGSLDDCMSKFRAMILGVIQIIYNNEMKKEDNE